MAFLALDTGSDRCRVDVRLWDAQRDVLGHSMRYTSIGD